MTMHRLMHIRSEVLFAYVGLMDGTMMTCECSCCMM